MEKNEIIQKIDLTPAEWVEIRKMANIGMAADAINQAIKDAPECDPDELIDMIMSIAQRRRNPRRNIIK